ncbi:MalY/PatB family protein [Clostridium sp. E02]|uniref:MalY/PatB family protein n=1 Tax=Clostridium sp. E02 TaxID=2487134 RepID=UPI000F51D8F8|nr:MalY/PatB family protein [Clostridium sp. E02]
MHYDFETLVRRENVGSFKWDDMKLKNPNIKDGIVPFSVADMELKNAPEIINGLKDYLDQSILGYTGATAGYYDSVIGWMEKRHGFTPKKEWIVETAGVVPGLGQMVSAFTQPEDAVMIMTPVYYPFRMAVETNKRKLVTTELINTGDSYEIDFEDFEAKAKEKEVKLLILCSPHNPVGRVWTEAELLKMTEICLDNEVFIISDEIHFDLILPGYQHVSMGTFEEKYLDNCVICTAPSKTFNLAGFQTSNHFISNEKMRGKITASRGYHSLNLMGYKACEIAYTKCGDWLDELLILLDTNRAYIEAFMLANLPEIKVYPLQGTYLQWMDFRGLGMEYRELEKFMQQKAQLFLDEGYIFGEGGKGFERINIACPTRVIKEAMERLLQAVNQYKKRR